MRAAFHSMEPRRNYMMRLWILAVYISISATAHFTLCDARTILQMFKFKGPEFRRTSVTDSIKRLKVSNQLDVVNPPLHLHASNDELYTSSVSSLFSLAPFESLAPLPLPENTPPFCEYPPIFTPQPPPPTNMPTSPVSHAQPPPPPPQAPPPFYFTPTSPIGSPSPQSTPGNTPRAPHTQVPNPPKCVPGPPVVVPGPPRYVPSPPPKHVPSPPVPVVSPPPGYKAPPVIVAVWCVAKPTVPDPIIQNALDYACGSGADCKSIQPNGSCFQPNTLMAHASYAFNSYWQRTKVAGGTCDFGGTAMLVTVDPSFDGCHFIYY